MKTRIKAALHEDGKTYYTGQVKFGWWYFWEDVHVSSSDIEYAKKQLDKRIELEESFLIKSIEYIKYP